MRCFEQRPGNQSIHFDCNDIHVLSAYLKLISRLVIEILIIPHSVASWLQLPDLLPFRLFSLLKSCHKSLPDKLFEYNFNLFHSFAISIFPQCSIETYERNDTNPRFQQRSRLNWSCHSKRCSAAQELVETRAKSSEKGGDGRDLLGGSFGGAAAANAGRFLRTCPPQFWTSCRAIFMAASALICRKNWYHWPFFLTNINCVFWKISY